MGIKERLILFAKFNGLSNSSFERHIGMSNGYIANIKKNIKIDYLERILKEFPNLNKDWLLYGVGDMFNDDIYEDMTINNDVILNEDKAMVEGVDISPVCKCSVRVPYISRDIVRDGNISTREVVCNGEGAQRTLKEIVGQADYVQRVITSAMMPLFQPGDYLFIKFLPDTTDVISGAIYLVDTKLYGAMVRKVYAIDNNNYRLCAINSQYDELYISRDDVYSISIVDKSLRSDFNTPDEVVRVSDMLQDYKETIKQQREEIARLHAIIDKLIK